MRFLDEQLVELDVSINTPQEAIKKAGQLLVQQDIVQDKYVKAMLDTYEQQGAYIVLAPGIAMPHARPEDGVNTPGVSLIQLASPIEFGHSINDPVYLVLALAGSTNEEHVLILQKLSLLLGNQERVEALMKAERYEDIRKILEGLV